MKAERSLGKIRRLLMALRMTLLRDSMAVSYTHLDVYKRQQVTRCRMRQAMMR